MAWLRRDQGSGTANPDEILPEDEVGALRDELGALIRYINVHSGSLPAVAVVTAREITDLAGELIDASAERPLDIYTTVAVTGVVTDHLPTTLKTFLSLGELNADVTVSLREQLESLLDETISLRNAERAKGADALISQEAFLRTKFSNSDLDL